MARRQYSDKHTLPADPSWVEFPRSDGDESRWPHNTTFEVDHEGQVNFMRPVPLDEPGPNVKWRVEIAAAMARALKWPEGPSYVLKEWPQNYRMFDHHKGLQAALRHDYYLMGSKSRFRSIPEFVPHAIWLMTDPTLDSSNCGCKYCAKKAQREITSSMDFLSQSPSSSRTSKVRERNMKDRTTALRGTGRDQRVLYKPYAAVQRMPKPPKLDHSAPTLPMLRERNSDLRAAYSSPKSIRLFREGELLWCHLDPPIRRSKDGISIDFWPGIVEEVKLRCESMPRTSEHETKSEAASENENVIGDPPFGDSNGDDSPTPWTVRQLVVYKMKLLAVSYSYTVLDDKVLPYQGYAPSSEVIHALRQSSWRDLDTRPESLATFNPCPSLSPGAPGSDFPDSESMFAAAVAPYGLAVQIAAKVSGYWSLTDEWDFKYLVIPGAAAAGSRPEPSHSGITVAATSSRESLHNVIAAAASRNAAFTGGEPVSSAPSPTPNISGPSHDLTPSELQDLGTRMVGAPAYPAQTVTQKRYQGLWWGGERIWVDELVRLKLARRQLAPEGAPAIYPPSGPSQSTLEYSAESVPGSDAAQDPDLGAGGRGVFMKLEGLFIADVPSEDGTGTRKECRASGMLYELADEDWADPHAEEHRKNKRKSGQSHLGGADSANGSSSSGKSFTPNTGLSQPTLSWPYPLPNPPTGFKFRPVLPPEHEAVVSLTLLSGRYYPQILRHPLMQPAVRACTNPQENGGGLHEGHHLWALEGLSPGYFNSVDPIEVKRSRLTMLKDGDKEARVDLEEACKVGEEHWQFGEEPGQGNDHSEHMDVDG